MMTGRKGADDMDTAGVLENGDFVRLYPINFRDLPCNQQYRKYQWVEVDAVRHLGRDARKESYRPNCETLQTVGDTISGRRFSSGINAQ